MNSLLLFAAHNSAIALVLAVPAYAVTRAWRNPPVAHLLWVLILLRLVAPPLVQVRWTACSPCPAWCRFGMTRACRELRDGQKERPRL